MSAKLLDNWWPKGALDREKIVYDVEALQHHPGETALGLFRDAKFAPVSGCIVGTVATTKRIVKETELANSKTAVLGDEVGEMYSRLSATIGSVSIAVDSQGVVDCTATGSGGHADLPAGTGIRPGGNPG